MITVPDRLLHDAHLRVMLDTLDELSGTCGLSAKQIALKGDCKRALGLFTRILTTIDADSSITLVTT